MTYISSFSGQINFNIEKVTRSTGSLTLIGYGKIVSAEQSLSATITANIIWVHKNYI